MLIRSAELDDAAAIAELLTQLGYPDTETFITDKLKQQLTRTDALLLVAVEDAQILGFISLHFIPQMRCAVIFAVSVICA